MTGSTQGGGGQEGMAIETPHLTDQTQNQPLTQTQPPMETMVSPLTAHLSTIAHIKDSAVTHTHTHSGGGDVGRKELDVELRYRRIGELFCCRLLSYLSTYQGGSDFDMIYESLLILPPDLTGSPVTVTQTVSKSLVHTHSVTIYLSHFVPFNGHRCLWVKGRLLSILSTLLHQTTAKTML